VNAGGAVEFLGGIGADETDSGAYAMLGHGGYEADGNHFGNISITTGTGAASSTTGYSHLGDLAGSTIGVLFKAGDREDNYVHLGLGGRSARTGTATTPYGLNGDITVISDGSVSFVGGTGSMNLDGDITGNNDFRLYAQLGHGGYDADAANSSRTIEFFGIRGGTGIAGTEGAGNGNWGHFGDIKVYAGGSVSFVGGDTTQTDPVLKSFGEGYGQYNYTQLGHGGYHASGDHSGNIDVRAGVNASGTVNNASADVYFAAGGPGTSEWNDIRSYAQLGHGGYNSSAGELGRAGESINVVAGRDVIVQGGLGVGNYAQIGHGGKFSDRNAANLDSPVGVNLAKGDIIVTVGRDVKLLGGSLPDNPTVGQGIKGSYSWVGAEATRSLDWAANLGSGADFTLQFSRIVPDSIRMEIRLDNGLLVGELVQVGTDIKVNGAFSVDVDGDGTAETFADGEVVATYNPITNAVTFSRDVNPGADAGDPNIRLFFEHASIDRAYAQIGHGGDDADYLTGVGNDPFATGDITVNSGGDVVLRGGAGAGNFAQIGHGGNSISGTKNGDILIGTAANPIGGAIIMEGGHSGYFDAADAYVQIGHGGRSSNGTATGDILIYASEARDVAYAGMGALVKAGSRNNSFAQIGHGGTGSRSGSGNDAAGMEGHSGDVTVDAIGDVNVIAGILDNGGGTLAQVNDDGNLYAQIGHGGYDVDVSLNGVIANGNGIGHNGDITVLSRQGDVNVLGGDSTRAFLPSFAPVVGLFDGYAGRIRAADIGQGGRFSWAQIGHGGFEARGNHFGDIIVNAGYDAAGVATGGTGNVYLLGGTGLADNSSAISYVQIGHGGRDAVGDMGRADDPATLGLVDRDFITVKAAGDVSIIAGSSLESYAQVGHGGRGSKGDHQADITVHADGALTVEAGGADPAFTPWHGGYNFSSLTDPNAFDRAANLANGGTPMTLGYGQVVAGSLSFDIYRDDGTFVGRIVDASTLGGTAGDLVVLSGFTQDMGAGAVTFSAGDKVGTIDYRNGQQPQVTFTVDVNPGASDGVGNLIVHFDSRQADSSFAQIGNGGQDADNGNGSTAGSTGDITVSSGGDVIFRAGTGNDNSVALGHGGRDNEGLNTGDIILTSGGKVGFYGGLGNNVLGKDEQSAQLGHGGQNARGDHVGSITVNAVGDIDFIAGTSARSAAQLGHGGWDGDWPNDENPAGAGITGAILVKTTTGNIHFSAGQTTGVTETWAQLGHGARSNEGNHTGTIGVEATAGTITFDAGVADNNYAQLGHGGYIARGNHSGQIDVLAGSGVAFTGGSAGNRAYAQLGHGGYDADTRGLGANAKILADINVTTTTGDIVFTGGKGAEAYTQLGNGGFNNDGDHGGNLDVEATAGSVIFAGGTSALNTTWSGYAQLGNGGNASRGDQSGNLTVTAGQDLQLTGGNHRGAWVQLGNGGRDADDPNGDTTLGPIGDITITVGGDVLLTAGSGYESYVQIGHGGDQTDGAASGTIEIDADGRLVVRSGSGPVNGGNGNNADQSGSRAYAQIGHGGFEGDGNHFGEICIHVGEDVLLDSNAGNASVTYSQIGHGGYSGSGNQSGFITVVSGISGASGGIALQGGNDAVSNDQYAQIGHGGTAAGGNLSGDITLIDVGGGGLTVTGGTAGFSYALVGHGDGASNTGGTRAGNIYVDVDGAITVTTPGPASSIGWIGHQSTNANEGITLGTANTTLFGTGFNASFNLTGMLNQALAAGITTIGNNSGNFTFDLPYTYSSANA
ncbi:MAG: hypothetical protein WBE58_00455, partial [Verrucomicrobiales bacterium]